MIQGFLEKLSEELSLPAPTIDKKKDFLFSLNPSISMKLRDLEPGLSIQAPLKKNPERKREELFIHLMKANLLGQGTGLCRIGMDSEEKTLTLLLGLPYEMNYQLFKQTVEDFANTLVFWRNEIERFTNETSIY